MKDKFIHQFVKDNKGNLIGCVAAIGAGKVGWSKCRTKGKIIPNTENPLLGMPTLILPDVFNKKRALEIALGRANTNPVNDLTDVPYALRDTVNHIKEVRSHKYFKPTL